MGNEKREEAAKADRLRQQLEAQIRELEAQLDLLRSQSGDQVGELQR